ncbi:hypothetical protein RN001_008909 [Aquatica leii]|uniref:GPI transamidase component PIG-T n=1 Tax=Aquatica leii TaxID=1421715 RepID=A0AAN7PB86_9COLE|nr:hypothetical protein RN001_008909 [Aquatica leii]
MKALLTLLAISSTAAHCTSDSFTEELFIKPLYTEHIYSHFHFSTIWNTDLFSEKFRHTHLFPRALGEIIKRHNVQELHLSLTAGLWRYETWGYPVTSAAPGAELWAWFKSDTEDVNSNWKDLASSLSGLICASFNFIDSSNSVSPQYSFWPNGVINEQKVNSSFLRYSSLPREIVCTENLTPWKKLLPCESKKGLASLLNSGYIHNTRYHSLSIHFRPICRDPKCKFTSIEVQQSVDLVYDYLILGSRNWSVRKLFGQGILGPCPLAKSSTVYVDVSSNSTFPFQLSPEPHEFVYSSRGGYESKFAKYEITEQPLALAANYIDKPSVVINSPPALHANQYLTGYGQELGGIVTKLFNNHWNTLDVVVLQNIPWYVPIYLHTLKILSNGVVLEPLSLKYIPGKLRERPYYLEIVLTLPPRSTTLISINFEHVFLKWTEYPPDASHGFYISSSVISSLLPLARNYTGLPQDATMIVDSFNKSGYGYLVQVRTEAMVVTLPTPDFSMPYNVICLACTVVALAFGPLHNITTKRLVLKPDNKEGLVGKIKQKLDVIKSKLTGTKEKSEDSSSK